ncbi:TetR/AcrR family transcriptional regulator [Bradyrhizobium sp. S3.5.5]|uniref:TetR/AcrR family transcriptional regulator n=1 Tax=unclassified Bradyrhizobium TaxID=2631580 RepID=UPI003397C5DA
MSKRATKQPKTQRRQGRPPKDDSQALREKIIAATRELLRTSPPDAISRIDIARAAKVDPALVRYYFGSKDDVLSTVALTFIDDFKRSQYEIPPSGDIQDLIDQVMTVMMRIIESVPYMHDLLVREISRLGAPGGAKIRDAFIDSPTARIEQAIRSTDSIRMTLRELQFFRMMVIAICAFPIRERGFVEQVFGRERFDAELTKEYGKFVARIFAQGMKPRSK